MSRKGEKERVLPEGWREVRLGETGAIHSGGTPSTTDGTNWGGSIYWLIPSEVTKIKDRFIRTTERTITEKGVTQTTLLPIKCLIVCTRATIGDACINTVPMAINQGFKCIEPAKGYHLDFLYYSMVQHKNDLVRLANGSTFGEVSKKDFANIKIPLPPLPEQKNITSLLETWDTAIEKTEALIEAKEKRFKWLLKRLISDQQDNPEWREVKLGEIFGRVLIIEKGKMLTKEQMKSGDYPVVAGGQVYAGYHNEFTHNTETITISGSGAYAGFVWFHNYPIFATDCNAITAKKGQGVTEYFYYAIKNQQNRLYDLQSGGAQPHIYAKDIATLQVLIPPIESQKQIVYTLNITQKEINLLKQLTEQYRTQKRGLMQKLLTGEWRTQR